MWTMKYSDMNSDVDWKKVFRDNFLGLIKFHKIPANVLMKEVDPLKVVPNDIIVTALAYQVSVSSSVISILLLLLLLLLLFHHAAIRAKTTMRIRVF